jgi:UDP-N-acetylmuramate--alanine ligase
MQQLQQFKRIHFIGIGGAGMSAIATILQAHGFTVQGSDLAENAQTRKLAADGAKIMLGQTAENILGADLVVTSTAIREDNPEKQAALAAGIPIWRRARVLAEIMRSGRSVAVSGTHGKTTTTSMLGLMLTTAGCDPTVLIGGEVNDFGGNARFGQGEWIVAEADESDASFLEMNPDRIITTNIEADHLDYYADLRQIEQTFLEFFTLLRPGGKLIACLDNPSIARLVGPGSGWQGAELITYGIDDPRADMRAEDIRPTDCGHGTHFVPVWHGVRLAEVELKIPGRHNVLNALAAIATGLDMGVPLEPMARALANFDGAKRRFQVKGEVGGVVIVDDYAHHPTEIAATLAAARGTLGGTSHAGQTCLRVVTAFQPHRYSRTQALAHDFGAALQGADLLVLTDVYSAGEKPIDGVSGRLVYDAALAQGHRNVHYCATLGELRTFLAGQLLPGDLCLTMGAGNVYRVGEELLGDLTPNSEALSA